MVSNVRTRHETFLGLHDRHDIRRNPNCFVSSDAWGHINMTDKQDKVRQDMRELSKQVHRDYIELIRLFPENQRKEKEIVQNHLSSEVID